MGKNALTRRDFLKTSAALAGALYLGRGAGETFSREAAKTSRVVLVRDAKVLDEAGGVDPNVMENMLDTAVTALLDAKSPAEAWRRLFKPEDVVGIKTNVWRHLPTPEALERSIRKRVVETGVQENNIGLGDRGILEDEIFQKATALVNVRPLRTHHWSGVGTLLKNYIMFTPVPWEHHDDSCADLAGIWRLPLVEGKTRLNILVVLTPLFHGVGPHHFNPEYTWPYKGLLVGLDPVAVDATGVRILEAKRKEYFEEERPINPPPKHVALADTRHHLGVADPSKIELVKIGWDEGILIG